eukprot:scaffold16078_cov61-Phaeocystis_antarctica.AAC.2
MPVPGVPSSPAVSRRCCQSCHACGHMCEEGFWLPEIDGAGRGRTRIRQCRGSRHCTWSRERGMLCAPEHAQHASDWTARHKRMRSKLGGHLVKACPLASRAHIRLDHCDEEKRDQPVRRYRL